SRTARVFTLRPALSAGSVEALDDEYVAATVASAGMLPLDGNAALAEAPLGSEGSVIGTVAAPGAAVGIATASVAEKLCGAPAGALVATTGGAPGTLEPEPPPPPQATSSAALKTAPPTKAVEIRFITRVIGRQR
ncbi:MAG: hypothetical protein M3154_04845, partial [Candidatus Eremiobacteraeota bacterium]|nr:hypothetical protein [Candidatus Eremiobacteraeota bacterium]